VVWSIYKDASYCDFDRFADIRVSQGDLIPGLNLEVFSDISGNQSGVFFFEQGADTLHPSICRLEIAGDWIGFSVDTQAIARVMPDWIVFGFEDDVPTAVNHGEGFNLPLVQHVLKVCLVFFVENLVIQRIDAKITSQDFATAHQEDGAQVVGNGIHRHKRHHAKDNT